jgi:hypothetical protein
MLTCIALLSGCARFPSGGVQTKVRQLLVNISFNGPIDDNCYYFIAIDTTGSAVGPQPVFPASDGSTGEEWLTGSANYYVMYHARDYTVYKISSLHPFSSVLIGRPVTYALPDVGGKTLALTLDLNSISATGNNIDLNIITLNQLIPEGRLLDGLGLKGTSFVNLDISSNRTYQNQNQIQPEGPNDVLDQNGVIQPPSDVTRSIDIVDWTISTNL